MVNQHTLFAATIFILLLLGLYCPRASNIVDVDNRTKINSKKNGSLGKHVDVLLAMSVGRPRCLEMPMRPRYYEREMVKHVGKVFEIDEHGQVWRVAIYRRGKKGCPSWIKPVKRRRAECRQGKYLGVQLTIWDGRSYRTKRIYAHRLVWQYFHGDVPDGLEINHKNSDKHDNRPENLELLTHAQNRQHAVDTGHVSPARGSRHAQAKLTETQVISIFSTISSGRATRRQMANEHGVTFATISYIMSGDTWKHLRLREQNQ